MRRLPLALACTLMAAMATVATAQNYYGYAPGSMPGGMPGMPPGGGYPGMMPGGAPAQTPPGIFPGAAQYHAKIPAPPQQKLPRGVSDDGGLLFYNGKPYQDVRAQLASYQAGAPGAAPSVMSHGAGDPAMQQQMQGDSVYGDVGSGNLCNECNDPYCTNCGRHPGFMHGLFSWLHGDGRGFPGKMGSVWSAGGELIYYTREHAPDRSLVLNNFDQSTELAAQNLDFVYEPGFRTWISYMGPSGIAAQFIYLQCNNMEASSTVRGDNDLQIPFPLAAVAVDFSGADRMTLDYETNLNSFEANIVYPWSSLQLLVGYRHVQVLERSSLTATDIDDGGTSVYNIPVCDNRLNGAQIGILGQYEAFGMVNFDFAAKWGIYGNSSLQHQILRDNDNEDLVRDTTGTDTDVAYVSELNARLVVPLGPTFSVQAGYDVLFINRLALATQQYDFDVDSTAGTFVSGGRNLIIHGVSGGLTAKW